MIKLYSALPYLGLVLALPYLPIASPSSPMLSVFRLPSLFRNQVMIPSCLPPRCQSLSRQNYGVLLPPRLHQYLNYSPTPRFPHFSPSSSFTLSHHQISPTSLTLPRACNSPLPLRLPLGTTPSLSVVLSSPCSPHYKVSYGPLRRSTLSQVPPG